VNQGDPTDNALAAIASMLDQPEVVGESEKPQSGEKSQSEETPQSEEKPQPEEKPAAPPVVEAHGYSRIGPGPMASLRFKWAVREDLRREFESDGHGTDDRGCGDPVGR
jgi:hypothetical protein